LGEPENSEKAVSPKKKGPCSIMGGKILLLPSGVSDSRKSQINKPKTK